MFSSLLLVASGYRADRPGQLLYEQYFAVLTPTDLALASGPATRTLGVAPAADTEEANRLAALEEGKYQYFGGNYRMALASLNYHLEGEYPEADDEAYWLAATAAMAVGEYATARELLGEADPEAATTIWYSALLDLKGEAIGSATTALQSLSPGTSDRAPYPVDELLEAVGER